MLLVDARLLLARHEIPSLLHPNTGGEAQFRHSLLDFACHALARRLDPDEIEAEITAQIRKLQQAGIPVSHLDSNNTHAHIPGSLPAYVARGAKMRSSGGA